MKKIICTFILALTAMVSINAQTAIETTKWNDNLAVSVDLGAVASQSSFHNTINPAIAIGVEKYLTPWIGVGVEAFTTVGVGSNMNSAPAFENFNLNGIAKVNISNFWNKDFSTKVFEPVVFAGLGWNHWNCTHLEFVSPNCDLGQRNTMVFKTGAELNFNLGKEKKVALCVKPAVAWEFTHFTLRSANLDYNLMVGVKYTIGKKGFVKHNVGAMLNEINELNAVNETNFVVIKGLNADVANLKNEVDSTMAALNAANAKIAELEAKPNGNTFIIKFDKDSATLSDLAKETLNQIKGNVKIDGFASSEGSVQHNDVLSKMRADSVAEFLKNNNVTVLDSKGNGVTILSFSRVAIVTVVD